MSAFVKRGSNSVIRRIKLSKLSDGSAYTGLDHNSAGFFITAQTDNEASGIVYKQADSNLEAGTVGSYTTPTAGKCRITEISAVNDPGSYQVELVDERYNVNNSNSLYITAGGVTDLKPETLEVHLGVMDSTDFPANFNLLSIGNDGFVGANLRQVNSDGTVIAAFLKALRAIIEGTAQSGTLSTTQMSTNLTQTDPDKYKGKTVIWDDGPNINTGRLVTASSGTTNVVLTYEAAPAAPVAGNPFILI